MAYLGNSPQQKVMLQVEARKSFSLTTLIVDPKGKPADLTGASLRMVVRAEPIDGTVTNLIDGDDEAVMDDPESGVGRFEIQAATLDITPGEYPYAIVLISSEGYSSVLVKGVLDVQQNTEFDSVNSAYLGVNTPTGLKITMNQENSLNVFVGGILPPGLNWIRDDIVAVIEGFDPDSIAQVPAGGTNGYVLTKTAAGDYAMDWRPVGNGEFALDATGQPEGHVPVALGDDTWIWDAVGIDATGVPEGHVPVSDGLDDWAWDELLTVSDWNTTPGEPGSILNKPTLGSASEEDASAFIASDTLVSEMPGIHFVTEIPATGTDGHLYFVYEA